MELNVVKDNGQQAGTIEVADSAFSADFNEPLIHQLVTAYLAGARSGTRAQKTRSDVRGGGAKPWRQKGTGRARAGTSRSPLWRSGGVTFAARPANHAQKVNKKMYRAGMRSIVSELHRQERLLVVDELSVDAPKTKALLAKLSTLGVENALLVTAELDSNLFLAARNLYKVRVITANEINPYDLVSYDRVVMTSAAIKQIEERLA